MIISDRILKLDDYKRGFRKVFVVYHSLLTNDLAMDENVWDWMMGK